MCMAVGSEKVKHYITFQLFSCQPFGSRPLRRRPCARTIDGPAAGSRAAERLKGESMNDLFSIEGRVALVTGGSRGIGRMIAAGYLKAGARAVYITARKAEACDATAKELSSLGTCVSIPCDVSTLDGIKTLVDAFSARERRLDILVNNAGAAWGETFDTFPEKGW